MRQGVSFGIVLIIAGGLLITFARQISGYTDRWNERITGRKHNATRATALVGVGWLILGIAILFGWD